MTDDRTTILFVEDNDDLREATADLLHAVGYRVVAVGSTKRALEALAAASPPIELLVVDAFMSEMTGAEAVERLRARGGPLPALLMSGFGEDAELRQRAARGEFAVLQMPFSTAALATKLEQTLAMPPPPVRLVPSADRDERRPPARPRSRRGGTPTLRLAAMLAAGVALAATMALISRPSPPELPPRQPGDVVRSARLETVAPAGELQELPQELDWQPVERAASYRVTLLSVDGSPLWKTAVAGPPARLPHGVAGGLRRAVRYVWWVEALDADGRPVARSERVSFRAVPAGGPAIADDGT